MIHEALSNLGERAAPRIRVLVADDHTVVREGIVSLLSRSGFCDIVAEASNGLEAVRRIHAELPDVRILVLTMHGEQEYVVPVVRAGAAGYLLKNAPTVELVAAVRALHAGKGFFAPGAAHAIARCSTSSSRESRPRTSRARSGSA